MAGTDNVDAHRLPGRARRHSRHQPDGHHAPNAAAAAEADSDQEIEAVTRLMGFLRQDDEL
jgi:hypothetical protein